MVPNHVETDAGQPPANPPGKRVRFWSSGYSRRIFTILGVVVVGLLVMRAVLVPTGFGRDGHYRPEAPAEEAQRAPIHQGKHVCAECHTAQFEAHERDVHVSVQCEDCHGAGGAHVAARRAERPKEEGPMFRNLEQANCLACHRQLAARPKLFPTIDVAAHFKGVGVAVADTPCQSCHDPHQPLFLERPVAEARIHPLIHQCSDCHHDPTVVERAFPAGHVVTFRCADCHGDLVADLSAKSHKGLECKTCHMFHADSEFSGRIYKNGSPEFCLLCHLDRPFKTKDGLPLIESFVGHREEMASDDADLKKRCVDCHMDEYIHVLRPSSARGVVVPAPAPATGEEGSAPSDPGETP